MIYRTGHTKGIVLFCCCLLITWLSMPVSAQSEYDSVYVKDYSTKILWSYFQEYRTLSLQIDPSNELDPSNNETLLLNSSTDLYSGFLIQYKGSSIYLAGSLPQSEDSEEEFGVQQSRLLRVNMLYNGFTFRLNQILHKGLYDDNYSEHQFAPQEDDNQFDRYNNTVTNWWSADLKYYPWYRQFALGLPFSFNLHQVKHKYTTGFSLGYNRLRVHNGSNPMFSPSLVESDPRYGIDYFFYSGINLAVGPSGYLAWPKGWFIYGDIWAGLGGGFYHLSGLNLKEDGFKLNFVLPESRIAIGYQSQRWLVSVFYSFQYENFNTEPFNINSTYHNLGLIIGVRSNSPARWMF